MINLSFQHGAELQCTCRPAKLVSESSSTSSSSTASSPLTRKGLVANLIRAFKGASSSSKRQPKLEAACVGAGSAHFKASAVCSHAERLQAQQPSSPLIRALRPRSPFKPAYQRVQLTVSC